MSASIYASRLLDKHLVLEPFTILKRQITPLTLVTLVTSDQLFPQTKLAEYAVQDVFSGGLSYDF
ncbi:MAG: hypothetical protein MUP08_04200, partial [Desulfobulbaceae bacterium]|nr:hypothetical protein [Desulfobulbaceae bacterium]